MNLVRNFAVSCLVLDINICVLLFIYICVLFSASEITYIVSGGALNSTHSLTLCCLLLSYGTEPAFESRRLW